MDSYCVVLRNGDHRHYYAGKEHKQRATMTSDIKYIRDSMDTIKLDNRKIQGDVGDLKIKVTEIEQGLKSAHKRLDDMQKKGG